MNKTITSIFRARTASGGGFVRGWSAPVSG